MSAQCVIDALVDRKSRSRCGAGLTRATLDQSWRRASPPPQMTARQWTAKRTFAASFIYNVRCRPALLLLLLRMWVLTTETSVMTTNDFWRAVWSLYRRYQLRLFRSCQFEERYIRGVRELLLLSPFLPFARLCSHSQRNILLFLTNYQPIPKALDHITSTDISSYFIQNLYFSLSNLL